MIQSAINDLVCSLYQKILHHPNMTEMGFGAEDADDYLINSMAYFLQQKGVAVDMLLYDVDLVNLATTASMALYVRALRIDGVEFDLMGNIGKDNIILGAMERHHSEAWEAFHWKDINIEPTTPVNEPKQVWDIYLDEQFSAFLQHKNLQETTRPALSRRSWTRL